MSNESRDHYQENGYVVPSPLCGFCCFQAVFKLELNLTLSVYLGNATFPQILTSVHSLVK